MKTYSDYVDYFENLCVQSPHIDHDPINNKKAFFTIHLDELLSGMRTKIDPQSVFFVLTDYVWKPSQVEGNYYKEGEGMFFVLGVVPPGDSQKHKEIMNTCEQIASLFINRIHLDSIKDQGNENSFWYGSQNQLDFDKVMPLKSETGVNHFGFQVIFRFKSQWDECVSTEDWNDKTDADSVNPQTPTIWP